LAARVGAAGRQVGGAARGAQAPPGRRDAELPQRPAPVAPGQRVAGARPGQLLERRPPRPGARGEVLDRAERPLGVARGDERLDLVGADPEHVGEADLDPRAVGCAGDRAADGAGVDVGREHLDAAPLRLVDQGVGRVEAHRLLIEQRRQELGAVVHAQPGRLVGQQPERGTMGLGEPEAREALDHRPHALGERLVDIVPARHRPRHEPVVVGLDRRGRPLAAHRAAQPLGLAG
jgi:hypothetical protein